MAFNITKDIAQDVGEMANDKVSDLVLVSDCKKLDTSTSVFECDLSSLISRLKVQIINLEYDIQRHLDTIEHLKTQNNYLESKLIRKHEEKQSYCQTIKTLKENNRERINKLLSVFSDNPV